MTKFSVQHAKQGCALTPASSSYRQLELSPPPPPRNKSSELQIYTSEMGGEGRQIPSTWLHRNLNFVCRYLVIPA